MAAFVDLRGLKFYCCHVINLPPFDFLIIFSFFYINSCILDPGLFLSKFAFKCHVIVMFSSYQFCFLINSPNYLFLH